MREHQPQVLKLPLGLNWDNPITFNILNVYKYTARSLRLLWNKPIDVGITPWLHYHNPMVNFTVTLL